MSIVELVRQPEGDASAGTNSSERVSGSQPPARSFESAARSLLEGMWSGTLIANTPEDQWLVHRIEDALAGLDEIREMSAGDDAESPRDLGVAAGKASILAAQAGATG